MTYSFADFKAYKFASIRRSIAKARAANAAGRHDLAVWYLHLTAVSRQSLRGS